MQTLFFASFVVSLFTYLGKILVDFVHIRQHSVTQYEALVAALF